MAQQLNGRRVAILATDGVEEVEYTEPRRAVEQAGAEAELISIKPGRIQAVQAMDKSNTQAMNAASVPIAIWPSSTRSP